MDSKPSVGNNAHVVPTHAAAGGGSLIATALPHDTILCVDDEPILLSMLSRTLARGLGPRFTIERASNGAEALAIIDALEREHTRVRLVISDAMMPVMDGYALIQWLHEHRPEVLKIMLTGCGHEERIEQLQRKSGLLACFSKPWRSQELLSFIEAALTDASARAATRATGDRCP